MDYSKINDILSTYNTSPSMRRALNYSTAEAARQEKIQQQYVDRENRAYNEAMDRLQGIEEMARKITFDRPDVKKQMQANYDELVKDFKEGLAKYDNDITKFWYMGGQAELDMFEKALFGGEYAQKLIASKPHVEKYLEIAEGKDGAEKLFKSTRDRFMQFMRGDVDSFSFGYDMMPYETEGLNEEYKRASAGARRIDVALAYNNNSEIAKYNYLNEYNLPANTEVSYEDLAKYAGKYLGGYEGANVFITDNDPKYSRTISDAVGRLGDRVNLGVISSRDKGVSMNIDRLKELTGLSLSERITDSPVGGFTAFKGDETKLVEAFIDPQFDSKNYQPDADIVLSSVDHSTGEMFGVAGQKLEESDDINGEKVKMHGVFLGFKTLDGEDRLLLQDEIDTYSGPVKPMYVMALKDDGGLFRGDEYIYKELKFSDPRRAKAVNDLIQVEDQALTSKMQSQYSSIPQQEKVQVSFADITRNSSEDRLYDFALYNDGQLEELLPHLGLSNPSLKMKSTLLALNSIYGGGEMRSFLNMFHSASSEDLNNGLVTNDPQLFLHNLSLILEKNGESKENIEALMKETGELSRKINNAIINKNK